MWSSRGVLLALAIVALAGAAGCLAPRHALPPPAPERRAGILPPDAGPAARFSSTSAALPPSRPGSRGEAVRRAVAAANALIGASEIVSDGVRYGDDCAALVRAALAAGGVRLAPGEGDVAALHALARTRGKLRRGKPAPGDLVFLSDRPGGGPEHVGLVQSVRGDGTALVLHRADAGVVRLRVNGAKAWKLAGEDGRAVNDPVVVGAGRIPAGRLLVGFATVL